MIWLFLLLFPILTAENFVVITPEKTGTHLLTRAITLLTNKDPYNRWERSLPLNLLKECLTEANKTGRFLHSHLIYEKETKEALELEGYRIVFLLRDPRDQLISMLFYINDKGWGYKKLNRTLPFGLLPFDDQIEEMITGKLFGTSVPEDFIVNRLGWKNTGLTVYFENLVGEKGGGNNLLQLAELKRLASYLNISIADEALNAIANQVFGWEGLTTFRSGQIGSWKKHFTERHKQLFKEIYGEELIRLGYESDFNW